MFNLEKILNKTIKYGLYAILLTPLVFWPRALYAFMTPKFILFQVLVEIVFGAWLILKIIDSRDRGIQSPTSSAVATEVGLQIALFVFFALSFISAFFGVDFQRSFWGIGARMTGLFAGLHFLAWFLVLISISKSDFDIKKYLNFSFAVSILVALSAFFQNTEWRLVFGSTFFNNPTFVAPYFLFHFFWGLYQTIFKKWLFGVGSALLFFVILLTQVRGAILGLFAGLLFSGLLLIFSSILSRRFKASILVFYVLLFSGLAGIWAFRDSSFVQNASVLKRLTQFSLSEATAQTRILTWQAALKGIKDNFWLGAGPENFNYVFNSHYNPALLRYSLGETWFDKPHNMFIEVLAETGIIGSLAYLLIWLTAGFLILKLWQNEEKLLSTILSGAFASYLVALFFSFDSFGSWFGLFLFLAFLASHDSNINNTNEHTNNTNGNFLKNIFVSFVCASLFVLLYVNYSIWNANIADADALRVFSQDTKSGLVLFGKSLSYKSPYKSEYQFDLIASVAGAVEKGVAINDLENVINFTLNETEKAVLAHPKNASSYTDMARIYNIFGTLGRDPEILAQAEQFGKKSLELSPNRQETLFYLARTALLQNKPTIAVEWAKQAVAADSTIGTSHWYLGLAYIADNQAKEGTLEIKKALDLGYHPKNDAEKNFIKNLGL